MEKPRGRNKVNKKMIALFRDYCSKCTIHGVQYVGDEERPLLEKLFWILIFIVCSCLNFYLIWQIWYKWQVSPVIVSFSETTTPVWQVPFPAITICIQANAKRTMFNFREAMKKPSEFEDKLSAMSLLCHPNIEINGSEIMDQESIQFLTDVSPSVDEVLQGCKMGNRYFECDEIFRPVFTEEGLCFTSNVLNHSEVFRDTWSIHPYPSDLPKSEHWTLDKGYELGSSIKTYPVRALTSGDKSGLMVLLATDKSNHDTLCRGAIMGYKVMLHNPAEIPISSAKYVQIPADEEILVWVQPNIMTTSDGLRSYSAARRQCFYPDERQLKFFKIYTERNCELECLTNYTLNKCGCVSVYMPRDDSTPVCGGGKKRCTLDAVYDSRYEEVERSYEGKEVDSCNCLPACTSITYMAETSQSRFDWKSTLAAFDEDVSDTDNLTMSRVTLFFTQTHFTTSHRSELFGIVDFLANCGGLLGLFSGISFLSLLEIIYFATLRPWGNRKMEQKEKVRQRSVGEGDYNLIDQTATQT